ncbi:acyl carrier protein [Helicobacter sp.]|uniref:acyl carrier protein n=1 Tax=Helicobacter sp. TaxID=218 RepID=UPI0025B8C783|nr:acyl carrier protein [Helicobacter sp.]MCI5969110.1 acyl carrier protein [Helicobacter sp.]MDY2584684.1 acyl carrier protein [Helicobacter sp.]
MEIVEKLFQEIGREDVTRDMEDLLEDGIIDSVDVIAFLSAAEKYYNKPISADFIEFDSFSNFANIRAMLDRALQGQ